MKKGKTFIKSAMLVFICLSAGVLFFRCEKDSDALRIRNNFRLDSEKLVGFWNNDPLIPVENSLFWIAFYADGSFTHYRYGAPEISYPSISENGFISDYYLETVNWPNDDYPIYYDILHLVITDYAGNEWSFYKISSRRDAMHCVSTAQTA